MVMKITSVLDFGDGAGELAQRRDIQAAGRPKARRPFSPSISALGTARHESIAPRRWRRAHQHVGDLQR